MIETEDYKAVYNCDDVTLQFDFTFPIFSEAGLDVKRYNGTTLSEETLIIGTDYYMEQATFGTWLDGGSVITYTTAYPTGDRISLTRDVSATQLLDYIENDPFPAESHERGLDKLTVLSQQLEELLSRSMLIPKSDPTGLDLELDSLESRFGKFIQFDEVTGEPILVTVLETSGIIITAWGEAWLGNLDSGEGLDQLGFSTFTKSLISAIDKAAWLTASGILLSDIGAGTYTLDDVADGATHGKVDLSDLTSSRVDLDKIQDGVTYAKTLAANLASGVPFNVLSWQDQGSGTPELRTKIVELGSWNMDVNFNHNVAHGMGGKWKNIRNVSIIVRNDADTLHVPFANWTFGTLAAYHEIDATNLICHRTTGGIFDTTDYDGTGFNRGHAFIVYEE